MAHSPQPAKKGYFFEQGYADIKSTIKQTFALVKECIDEQKDKMDMAGKWGKIFRVAVIISLWLFGGLFSISIAAVHSVVNFVFMLLYYI